MNRQRGDYKGYEITNIQTGGGLQRLINTELHLRAVECRHTCCDRCIFHHGPGPQGETTALHL